MEASAELREIIAGWFAAAVRGDASWRDRHVSRNANLRIVGTDPSEWLLGEPAYRFLKEEAETVGGKFEVSVSEVEAFSEGSVGWGVALPRIRLPDGRQASPRWSAVFHREADGWKLVQLHASIGVSNEEAFGSLFQT